jgi:[acyl-carrier-protein] S-malonyltransferase
VPVEEPTRLLLSNADGTAVATGIETIKRLVAQVTSPVRWDLCQATLRDLGVTAVIELPPAGTLVGLAKRELPGVESVAVKTPDDLAAARDLLDRHGGPLDVEPSVSFRVVVAPGAGTFSPAELAEGDTISAGTAVGHVMTRQGTNDVAPGYDGVLVEWLAHDGDPVAPGQPLARLHPTTGGPR